MSTLPLRATHVPAFPALRASRRRRADGDRRVRRGAGPGARRAQALSVRGMVKQALRGAFDHAHVALDIAGAEHFERLFVGGRVVAGERLVQAVELDQHHALVHAGLVGFGRLVADQKAAAGAPMAGPASLA